MQSVLVGIACRNKPWGERGRRLGLAMVGLGPLTEGFHAWKRGESVLIICDTFVTGFSKTVILCNLLLTNVNTTLPPLQATMMIPT